MGASIAWFVLPIAVWAALLILRPDQPDIKRFFLFMIGTGLALTLFVEVIVLKGDIGRMNTVYKFYVQVWVMLALSSAMSFYWLMDGIHSWNPNTAELFKYTTAALTIGVLLFPIMAGMDKIRDRYVPTAPHSLDGLQYMNGATWLEHDITFDTDYEIKLEQDNQGIRWMQQNVAGSPVIVEGNVVEYRWGNRYTINTGLPGVLGWNWHQRQQRGVVSSEWVTKRVDEIGQFYSLMTIDEARNFIAKYNVKYIVVGQLEKAIYAHTSFVSVEDAWNFFGKYSDSYIHLNQLEKSTYPSSGLEKFELYDGIYWKEVFNYKDTTIYEVIGD